MHANGADRYTSLAARVAELETAIGILARRWEVELVPRLVEIDADLDHLARAVVRSLNNGTEAAGGHPIVPPAVRESSSATGADDGAASVPPAASVARSSPSAARERPAPVEGKEPNHVWPGAAASEDGEA